MHPFCGKPIEEESFGQATLCPKCDTDGDAAVRDDPAVVADNDPDNIDVEINRFKEWKLAESDVESEVDEDCEYRYADSDYIEDYFVEDLDSIAACFDYEGVAQSKVAFLNFCAFDLPYKPRTYHVP